jgi:hypothetical protein
MNLAYIVGQAGDKARGRALNEENLVAARARRHRMVEAGTLDQLAWLSREADDLDAAIEGHQAALRIWTELGYPLQVAIDLGRLAFIFALLERAEPAGRLLGKSEAMMRGLTSAFSWATKRNEQTRALLRDLVGDRELARLLAEGEAMAADEAVDLALGEAG